METPQPKPSKLKRFFRRALFALAALITLAALFIAEEDWRGARAWRSYKQQMEAKGEHFDAARLIPPKVPDDQNFAMTPYFAPFFDLPPEILRQPIKYGTDMIGGGPIMLVALDRGTNIDRIKQIIPSWFDRDIKRPPRPLGWNAGTAVDLTGWAAAIQAQNPSSAAGDLADPVQAAAFVLDT